MSTGVRWLSGREILRLQGFPEFYIGPNSHKKTWELAGEAFPPPYAFLEITQAVACILPDSKLLLDGMWQRWRTMIDAASPLKVSAKPAFMWDTILGGAGPAADWDAFEAMIQRVDVGTTTFRANLSARPISSVTLGITAASDNVAKLSVFTRNHPGYAG